MTRMESYSCDGACGKVTRLLDEAEWFVLQQTGYGTASEERHFCSLDCVQTYSEQHTRQQTIHKYTTPALRSRNEGMGTSLPVQADNDQ